MTEGEEILVARKQKGHRNGRKKLCTLLGLGVAASWESLVILTIKSKNKCTTLLSCSETREPLIDILCGKIAPPSQSQTTRM